MGTLSANLSDGPRALGPLADRGAFDQYASYRPGQVVVDDSVVYLNIAPIGAAPDLEDTFDRRDQQGWGQSSHGEAWQTSEAYANGRSPAIVGGRGVAAVFVEGLSDAQLLGPAVLRASTEVLLALALPVPVGEDIDQLKVWLNCTEDGMNEAGVFVSINNVGVTALILRSQAVGFEDADSDPEAGPTITAGQACYLRLRRVGLVYSATLWAAGTAEPATAQVTQTASHAQPAGHPLIGVVEGAEGDAFTVSAFSLRPLTAATVPGDDTDHWVALADALQVPQPL